ncbi:MAG: methyltransferase domain-containing protein [Chthoniobacterales bacterium]
MTDWNELYRIGEMPWEKGAAAPPLLSWMARHSALTGDVLVPGCGFGHDVRAIAMASPDARVVGLDVAPLALAQAKKYPQAGNESYICADLFRLPAKLVGAFDWIFEHTCFCVVLPAQRVDYVRAMATALRKSGQILAIFFLDPWDPGEAPPEGGPPFGVSTEELNELFLPEFQLLLEERPKISYPGREGREVLRLLRKR